MKAKSGIDIGNALTTWLGNTNRYIIVVHPMAPFVYKDP
jgi:hypothetical protein